MSPESCSLCGWRSRDRSQEVQQRWQQGTGTSCLCQFEFAVVLLTENPLSLRILISEGPSACGAEGRLWVASGSALPSTTAAWGARKSNDRTQDGAWDIEAHVGSQSRPRTGLVKMQSVGDGAIGICSADPDLVGRGGREGHNKHGCCLHLPEVTGGDREMPLLTFRQVIYTQEQELQPPNAPGSPGSRRGRSLGDTKRSAGRRDGARWGFLSSAFS